eukprot:Platyproteum_vivax@DN5236_c0_g1_i1.p1
MGERKVLNKYYPPDFDPQKLWAARQLVTTKGSRMMNVRMMFPFSLSCNTCGEYTWVGKKFNSQVERIKDEDYLGLPIWRFYARCPHCRAEIVFKTDPKNAEYTLETGGTRTYEAHKDADAADNFLKEWHSEKIEGNAMLELEKKTFDTQQEMETLNALDEIRHTNKRQGKRNEMIDNALNKLFKKDPTDELCSIDDDLEEEVSNFESLKREFEDKQLSVSSSSKVKDEKPELKETLKKAKPNPDNEASESIGTFFKKKLTTIKVMKKEDAPSVPTNIATTAVKPSGGLVEYSDEST